MLRYLRYPALKRCKSLSKDSEEEIKEGLEESLSGGRERKRRPRRGRQDRHARRHFRGRRQPAPRGARLHGRIRVRAGEPGSIRVRARLKKPHGVQYSATQEGDLVTVEAKPDRQSEGFPPGFSRQHTGANIEVTVPVTTSVDLATSNGPVELQGTESGGTVQTKNGPIRVEQFKGDLNAQTKNAPITVKTLSGAVQLSTLNSRVSIEDGRGRFEVRTINGTIKFQGSMEPNSHKQAIHLERQHQSSPRRRTEPQADGCDDQRASPLRGAGLCRSGREAP